MPLEVWDKISTQEYLKEDLFNQICHFAIFINLLLICHFAILRVVQLLGKNIIDDFKKKHATSRKALDRWIKLIEAADFKNPQDIKQLFGGNVDFVSGQTVFDVGGNKIRAITKIAFGVRVVLVTDVLTHTEYDKNKWKD